MLNFSKIWDDNGFEIILGICIAVILIYGFYRKINNQKGNWSDSYSTYTLHDIDKISFNKKKIIKESKG